MPGIDGTSIRKIWLTNPERRDITGLGLYYPDKTPHRHLSLYMGHAAQLLPRTVKESEIEPFLYHLSLFTENQEQQDWMMNYLADLVQNPLRQGQRIAISIKGKQRTGKSQFGERIKSFFHELNTYDAVRADRITGRFNNILSSKIVVTMSEFALPTGGGNEARDIIKALITDPKISIEYKQGAILEVPNHLHFIHTTNHQQSYLFDAQDFRWSVFEIVSRHQNDFKFWAEYNDWWDKGGRDLTFTYLMQLEYDKYMAMTQVQTKAIIEEKLTSLTAVDRWVLSVLSSYRLGTRVEVTTSNLHHSYLAWMGDNEPKKHPFSIKKFGGHLNRLNIFTKHNNIRIIDVNRDRKAFEESLGISIDWEDVKHDTEPISIIEGQSSEQDDINL